MLANYRSTSDFFSEKASDPFGQQQGVVELCKCLIFHSKFVQVQKVRLSFRENQGVAHA